MLNHIVVMGRLTRDPELRKTASGVSVASFSVAVDRDFSQQDGKKETDFLDVVAWRNTAEFAAKYFTKGRMAVVSGRLQIRNWEDKEGNKRRTAEILAENIYFGDSKKEDDSGSASMQGSTQTFIASYFANNALFVCLGGVNAHKGLRETLLSLGVTEVMEAMDMDQFTNPQVRQAIGTLRREVQSIPGIRYYQCTWNPRFKGVDDYLLDWTKRKTA